jgi:predicted DNA-binding transcriptional regulator AlpA
MRKKLPPVFKQFIGEDELLTEDEMLAITGLSRSTARRRIKVQKLPAPVHLIPGTTLWIKREISNWAAEQIPASMRNAA